MCTLGIISKSKASTVTAIPNRFIDEYMMEASGTDVKVYLYLLRHMSDGDTDISVHTMADFLDCTEKSLLRSLSYWTRQGILEYTVSDDGAIDSIRLADLSDGYLTDSLSRKEPEPKQTPVKPMKAASIKKSPAERIDADAASYDADMSFILSSLESYYDRALSAEDIRAAQYIHLTLGFSSDLLLFLYEICIDQQKAAPKYVVKKAEDWHANDVHTVEEAKNYMLLFSDAYNTFRKGFGISDNLTYDELSLLRTWVNDWHMSAELIGEACRRTTMQGHRRGYSYANKILSDWRSQGVTTLQDIAPLDEKHRLENAEKPAVKKNSTSAAPKKPNMFNDFNQRTYSAEQWKEIEKRMYAKK